MGIDHYQLAPLSGCVNDAAAILERLDRHENGDKNFDCNPLTSDGCRVTASRIREALQQLVTPQPHYAVFHFSGHGAVDDGGRTCLVAQDGEYIRMEDILDTVAKASVTQTLVMLDCCFSGGMGKVPILSEGRAVVSQNSAFLVASRQDEPASERGGAGVFTSLVTGALDGGACDVRGVVTLASLYTYIDEGLGSWEQRPALTAHLEKLQALRQCKPLVEDNVLRLLPEWFGDPEAMFPLSPAYEPRAEPKDPEKEAMFGKLQRCNRARLVDPVDHDHMYDAAMESTGCVLTPLGRRYRRMAKDGRL